MSDDADARTVVIERELPFAPETVWRALTQPHLMVEWLMRPEGFELAAGRPFSLSGEWGSVDCRVLEVDPGRRLSYRWDHASAEAA